MSFLLKWRLKKHIETHNEEKIRTCYYYNNKSECPFSEMGCKFLHVRAGKCKYGSDCKTKLCQYSHKWYETSVEQKISKSIMEKGLH